MPVKKPVYAESFGLVYKFSRMNWKKMLRRVANGEEVEYQDYAKPICTISHNITDLDDEVAKELLENDE